MTYGSTRPWDRVASGPGPVEVLVLSTPYAYNQDYFENVVIGGLGGAVNILKASYSMGEAMLTPHRS
ncbi:MAG: hypothetical protein ACO2O2_04855 [Acidilobaceae archaeon]|jgi:hypothetical protein